MGLGEVQRLNSLSFASNLSSCGVTEQKLCVDPTIPHGNVSKASSTAGQPHDADFPLQFTQDTASL